MIRPFRRKLKDSPTFGSGGRVYVKNLNIVVIDDEGNVFVCGHELGGFGIGEEGKEGAFLDITNIKSVACNKNTLFLDKNGEVWSCGSNLDGDSVNSLHQIPEKIPNLVNIHQIFFSYTSTYFLTENAEVWSCGNNAYGQLGHGDFKGRSIPEKIQSLPPIDKVIAGPRSILLLDNEGAVWGIGENLGTLGIQQYKVNVPVRLPNLPLIKFVATWHSMSIFIGRDGSVWACGSSVYSNGGFVSTGIMRESQPVLVPQLKGMCKAWIEHNYTIFLDEEGIVYGCGGYSGDGLANRAKPGSNYFDAERITSLPRITDVALGGLFCLFLDENGSVWACGLNQQGQLGNADPKNQPIHMIENLPTIRSIYAVETTSVFVDIEGLVWVCGEIKTCIPSVLHPNIRVNERKFINVKSARN